MIHKLAAYLMRAFAALLILTCRVKIEGMEHFVKAAKSGSLILLFWHDRMALFPKTFRSQLKLCHFTAVISKSRDGNWLNALIHTYPNSDTIRVGHTARPQALKEMMIRLKEPQLALMVTPDGPRGPRHKLKPGPIKAAQESGSPLIPFSWTSSKSFFLSSWDRFEIPKPFSKIEVKIGEPIFVSKSEPIEEAVARIEGTLDKM